MTNHQYVDLILKIGGTIAGGSMLYLLQSGVKAAIQLRDDVRDLKNNHVPHLQDDIKELKEAIHELSGKIH